MGFHGQLAESWRRSSSNLCVGLDPDPARFPVGFDATPNGIEAFCRAIVDVTADVVCAFKPQIAYFAACGAEGALEGLCRYIREAYPEVTLILDAKRGDIGSTAEQYAIEAFDRYGAHAVTVNPYLGTDSVEPFLNRGGVIALCRTSNPGSGELQALDADGAPVYVRVAEMVATRWSSIGDCGLVVGATYPDDLTAVRSVAPDLPLLIPGVGAQGGDPGAVVDAARATRSGEGVARDGGDGDGATGVVDGLIVSTSRAVLYASSGSDFDAAARRAALDTVEALRAAAS